MRSLRFADMAYAFLARFALGLRVVPGPGSKPASAAARSQHRAIHFVRLRSSAAAALTQAAC